MKLQTPFKTEYYQLPNVKPRNFFFTVLVLNVPKSPHKKKYKSYNKHSI